MYLSNFFPFPGGVNGNIFLNGDITSRQQMLAISGFVPQEDLTVKFLTVYEQMNFMVCLGVAHAWIIISKNHLLNLYLNYRLN